MNGAFCHSCHFALAWATTEELHWPQHDCPKVGLSPCFGSLCKLPCSHETQGLVNYFCAPHDQNCFRVGHGGNNQQQHILVVNLLFTESRGLPPHIWGMGWLHPPSPLIQQLIQGAEFVRWSLHTIEHLCLKPEPPNLSRQQLPAHL